MFTLSIVLFALSISVHELGHAFAMRHYGVKLRSICLLGFGQTIFKFTLPHWFGNTPVLIKLFPIGAFVEPSEEGSEKIEGLKYSEYVHIYGAGIIANCLYSGALLLISALISGFVEKELVIAMILIIIGLFPRYSSHLIIPVGLFIAFVISFIAIDSPAKIVNDSGSFISIVEMMQGRSNNLVEVTKFGAILSFSVAIFNVLPLIPLDGGRIFLRLLKNIFYNYKSIVEKIYVPSTLALFLVLILLSIGNDLIKLWHWFF